jgi:hypothetical protein
MYYGQNVELLMRMLKDCHMQAIIGIVFCDFPQAAMQPVKFFTSFHRG